VPGETMPCPACLHRSTLRFSRGKGMEDSYRRAVEMAEQVATDPKNYTEECRAGASLIAAVDRYHRYHLANVNDYVSRLIGAERGLCRCCGRAHAIQHEDDCPVPHLVHLTSGA